MFRRVTTNQAGFTLIELLVVIAIIGVLASTVLASMNSARISGRNATRLSETRQLMTALELYRNQYGGYPCVGSHDSLDNTTNANLNCTDGADFTADGTAAVKYRSSYTPSTLSNNFRNIVNFRPSTDATYDGSIQYRVGARSTVSPDADNSRRSGYVLRLQLENNAACLIRVGNPDPVIAVWAGTPDCTMISGL